MIDEPQQEKPQQIDNQADESIAPSTSEFKSNRDLSILGLVLGFFFGIVGVIISIVCLNQSKKQGQKNKIAVWGIIVGSVMAIVGVACGIAIYKLTDGDTGKARLACAIRTDNKSTATIGGVTYSCTTYRELAQYSKSTDDSSNNDLDVYASEVKLSGTKVDSKCWSFEMPENYILSPSSISCQTEIRQDNGTSRGESLTAVMVKSQIGESTIDEFFEKIRKTGVTILEEKKIKIDGIESGKVVAKNSLGINTDMYYVPYPEDTKLNSKNSKITSVLISGPSAYSEVMSGIIDSFSLK